MKFVNFAQENSERGSLGIIKLVQKNEKSYHHIKFWKNRMNKFRLFFFFFIFRPKNVPSLNPVSLTNFLMPGSSGNFRNTLWTYL